MTDPFFIGDEWLIFPNLATHQLGASKGLLIDGLGSKLRFTDPRSKKYQEILGGSRRSAYPITLVFPWLGSSAR
jgi:hypothetical protein